MDRLTYEPERLTDLIDSFSHASQFTFSNLTEYLDWRSKILPFLALQEQPGRTLLYNLAFMHALLSSNENTQIMCKILLKRILDQEFAVRIREIEAIRRVHQ